MSLLEGLQVEEGPVAGDEIIGRTRISARSVLTTALSRFSSARSLHGPDVGEGLGHILFDLCPRFVAIPCPDFIQDR